MIFIVSVANCYLYPIPMFVALRPARVFGKSPPYRDLWGIRRRIPQKGLGVENRAPTACIEEDPVKKALEETFAHMADPAPSNGFALQLDPAP